MWLINKKHHTLESIAKLAGVSRSTVSRVINNKGNVSEKARKKVLSVIKKEKYYPNASARSLASRKTNNIGIIFWGHDPEFLSNPIYYEILQGIQRESLKHDLNLVLYTTHKEEEKRQELCYKIIGQKNVDGLIVIGSLMYFDYLKLFANNDLPVVIIGKRDTKNLDIPYVCTDYEDGIYKATRHLLSLGRKEIVLLQSTVDYYFLEDKLRGYKRALEEKNIKFNSDYIIEVTSNNEDYVEKIVRNHILTIKNINAIICANDILAQNLIKVITSQGIAVPDNISVIGF